MKRPSDPQVERAKRLLALEGEWEADAEECAEAAGRVYDKLADQLAPLLGGAGVQAMFVRSAKLARGELPFLAELVPAIEGSGEGATGLRAYLLTLEPDAATQAATVLFGTFLDLIISFIGDRLTVQVLRGAWPKIDETPDEKVSRGSQKNE
jgi:hypothetical protein